MNVYAVYESLLFIRVCAKSVICSLQVLVYEWLNVDVGYFLSQVMNFFVSVPWQLSFKVNAVVCLGFLV